MEKYECLHDISGVLLYLILQDYWVILFDFICQNIRAGVTVCGAFPLGSIVRNLGFKTESSKPGSPRMSADGEGRREVSLAEIAKREAAIGYGMLSEPSSSGTPVCCRSFKA